MNYATLNATNYIIIIVICPQQNIKIELKIHQKISTIITVIYATLNALKLLGVKDLISFLTI